VQIAARLRAAGLATIVVPVGSTDGAGPIACAVTVAHGGCTVEIDGRTQPATVEEVPAMVRSAVGADTWIR